MLWLASLATGVLHMNLSVASVATAFAALLGCAGIQFVLLRATTNLDARQAVAYGDEPRYRSWTAWRGPIAKAETGSKTDVSELYN